MLFVFIIVMCGANMLLDGGYECFSCSTFLHVHQFLCLKMCLTEMILSSFAHSARHCASIVLYVGAQERNDVVI